MRFAILVSALLAAQGAFAQESGGIRPVSAFRVQFAVHELESAKRVGTKDYSMLTQENSWGRIQIGTKVSVPSTGNNGWSYIDVGMNLRARLTERDSQILLDLEAGMNGPADQDARQPAPMLRNVSSNINTVIPLGKPTTVLTMDDPGTKRRYEIEVTATKVK